MKAKTWRSDVNGVLVRGLCRAWSWKHGQGGREFSEVDIESMKNVPVVVDWVLHQDFSVGLAQAKILTGHKQHHLTLVLADDALFHQLVLLQQLPWAKTCPATASASLSLPLPQAAVTLDTLISSSSASDLDPASGRVSCCHVLAEGTLLGPTWETPGAPPWFGQLASYRQLLQVWYQASKSSGRGDSCTSSQSWW